MYDDLRNTIGAPAFKDLQAMIAAQTTTSPPATLVPSTMEYVRGTLKSWSMWFGAVLIGLPTIAPDLIPAVQDMFGPDLTKRIVQAIGLITILLRLKTNESIKDKGSPPEKGTSA